MLKKDFSKVWDFMEKSKLDVIIFSDPDSICYITGYSNQTDSSFPFKGSPILAIILKGEYPKVIIPITEKESFDQDSWVKQVSTYINYDYQHPLDIGENVLRASLNVLKNWGINKGIVGYEASYMQANIYTGLSENFPHLYWKNITGKLAPLRTIKTTEELKAISEAAFLCDIGQNKIRELTIPGKSEIAIFSEARASMELAAGKRIQLSGDLVSGKRCGAGGAGLPTDVILKNGEVLISDIIPRLNGWWADCCCTNAIGKTTTFYKKIYQIVMEALNIGVEKAKPGMLAFELDFMVRSYIEKHGYKYEHHTGHGVGVAQAEPPWIVPYNKEELKEGMVITLEPAIYIEGKGGVRIEGLFIINRDRLEPLTKYNRQLEL